MSYMLLYADTDRKLLVGMPHSCSHFDTRVSIIPASPAIASSKTSHWAASGMNTAQNQKAGAPHACAPIAAQQFTDKRPHTRSLYDDIRFNVPVRILFLLLFMKRLRSGAIIVSNTKRRASRKTASERRKRDSQLITTCSLLSSSPSHICRNPSLHEFVSCPVENWLFFLFRSAPLLHYIQYG